jgi:hypothetical protein
MSHQGRNQNAEDMVLIRRYPEVFPNFYLLPAPDLDRGLLLELREFTLMAVTRFRWLISAVDQATTGVLDVFGDWRRFRERRYPSLAGPEMRHYYRTPQSGVDFSIFLRGHVAGKDPAVVLLLTYEDAVTRAAAPDTARVGGASCLEPGSPLDWEDIPIRDKKGRVIELPWDLESVIDGVKNNRPPQRGRGPHYYVVSQAEADSNSVHHVSRGIAKVVEACDGRRTMKGVTSHLANVLPEVASSLRDYICVALVEKAHAAGLLAIYRTASEAADSHDGAFVIPEYSEISAAASVQNVSSAQAQ